MTTNVKKTYTRCICCRWTGCETRELTADEIALIGYEPESTLVCAECNSLFDTLVVVEVSA